MVQGDRVSVYPEKMPELASHAVVVLRANHRALVVAFFTVPSFAYLYDTPKPTDEYVLLLYQPTEGGGNVWSSLPPVGGTFVVEPVLRIDK